jgi:NAD(P)-dependent dehydrogenase (short-subunit alcohol dehydrogenase family)/uncharacterized protein YndB with AHSA1/START domain
MQFEGKTAFITGGAQGIGRGIAGRLAKEGVKLALADIDADALATARAELSKVTDVEAYVLDVRDRDAFATVADQVESQLGPVSLLFNNAGVAGRIPVTQMSYQTWDWMLGINLNGVVNGIQTFLPRMIQRGQGGHVVNTSSGAGVAAAASGYLYCTSKFAVVGMSETLRMELEQAKTGIGVSVLCPGPVATNIIAHSSATRPDTVETAKREAGSKAQLEAMQSLLAAGATPDEVGDMVLRAIIDNSAYIFTDSIMADAVVERAEAMIAAMPAAPEDADDESADDTATTLNVGGRKPRKMRSFTLDAAIPAPPAEVFALVADPARMGEWVKGHVGFTQDPPKSVKPGVTFRQQLETMGSSAEVSWLVTQAQAPTTFEMQGNGPMGIRFGTLFSLQPSGDGTALTLTMEMGGGPLMGPVGKVALNNSREYQLESLQKLKSLFAW